MKEKVKNVCQGVENKNSVWRKPSASRYRTHVEELLSHQREPQLEKLEMSVEYKYF